MSIYGHRLLVHVGDTAKENTATLSFNIPASERIFWCTKSRASLSNFREFDQLIFEAAVAHLSSTPKRRE
jgi:hypothetical protein